MWEVIRKILPKLFKIILFCLLVLFVLRFFLALIIYLLPLKDYLTVEPYWFASVNGVDIEFLPQILYYTLEIWVSFALCALILKYVKPKYLNKTFRRLTVVLFIITLIPLVIFYGRVTSNRDFLNIKRFHTFDNSQSIVEYLLGDILSVSFTAKPLDEIVYLGGGSKECHDDVSQPTSALSEIDSVVSSIPSTTFPDFVQPLSENSSVKYDTRCVFSSELGEFPYSHNGDDLVVTWSPFLVLISKKEALDSQWVDNPRHYIIITRDSPLIYYDNYNFAIISSKDIDQEVILLLDFKNCTFGPLISDRLIVNRSGYSFRDDYFYQSFISISPDSNFVLYQVSEGSQVPPYPGDSYPSKDEYDAKGVWLYNVKSNKNTHLYYEDDFDDSLSAEWVYGYLILKSSYCENTQNCVFKLSNY